MQYSLNPYISFKGRAREAMTFYQSVFGGELKLTTFAEFGINDAPADGVMHGELAVDGRALVMGSDAFDDVPQGFALALGGSDSQALHDVFEKLSDDATNVREIRQEAWGDEYGELVDKFGVRWMVNIAAAA